MYNTFYHTTTQVFDLLMDGSELVEKLQWNTTYFRSQMSDAGFVLKVGIIITIGCCCS